MNHFVSAATPYFPDVSTAFVKPPRQKKFSLKSFLRYFVMDDSRRLIFYPLTCRQQPTAKLGVLIVRISLSAQGPNQFGNHRTSRTSSDGKPCWCRMERR